MPRFTLRRLLMITTLALTSAGCASAPTHSPPPGADKADPGQVQSTTGLVYGDLSAAREAFGRGIERGLGPFERTEVEEISGARALEVLASYALDPAQMQRLEPPLFPGGPSMRQVLETPGLRVWLFRGHSAHLSEINELFIPMPEVGAGAIEPLVAMGGPGIRLQLGALRLKAQSDPPQGSPELADWPTLTPERFEALLQSGERFVVYQHLEGCMSAPMYNGVLNALELPEDLPIYVDHSFATLGNYADALLRGLPASSFVVFEKGDWRDVYPALTEPVDATMAHFLARNALVTPGPSAPVIAAADFVEGSDLARGLTLGKFWSSLQMRDQDLRGLRITHGAISGSDFSGADLSHAHLAHTLISHTSFEGARTEGLTLQGVVLREVTCVDGSVRSGEVGDCLGG
ncbi:hypothetical protein DL240_19265 [Lujinxingia litoralis]|uniref:Pentapeptide repeat-containing protein n=1 Tax=Lujinxingia litoralis TaxID=2211119 RepID=A0A328C3X4_9DELT|nr:pentapeptide repeat-containing protein [Lujinxingia litoralis]RAL19992.1 hypothetical protein DL240_19265 [Lujinxingia litoralis]